MTGSLVPKALVVLPLAVLASCSMGTGIRREAALDGRVDIACIESALRQADGVNVTIARDYSDKSFEVAPDWGPHNVNGRMFAYDTPSSTQIGFSVFYMEPEAVSRVQHVWGKQDRKEMAPAAAEAAVRNMVRIERAIGAACNIKFEMKTTCTDVDCKPVEAAAQEIA